MHDIIKSFKVQSRTMDFNVIEPQEFTDNSSSSKATVHFSTSSSTFVICVLYDSHLTGVRFYLIVLLSLKNDHLLSFDVLSRKTIYSYP